MIAEAVKLAGAEPMPRPNDFDYQPLYGNIGAVLALSFGQTGT